MFVKMYIVIILSFFISNSSFAIGKNAVWYSYHSPGWLERARKWEEKQAEAQRQLIAKADAEAWQREYKQTWELRKEHWQQALSALSDARLLPFQCVRDIDFSLQGITNGKLREANACHFFWTNQLDQIYWIQQGVTHHVAHRVYCCEDENHGEATKPNSPVTALFARHCETLTNILGSTSALRNEGGQSLSNEKVVKIPDYAEVFLMDYVIARDTGLKNECEKEKNYKLPQDTVLKWSCESWFTAKYIGDSIAYKVSKTANFNAFARVPFFKHMDKIMDQTISGAARKQAKKLLIAEILLGFHMHHAGVANFPDVIEAIDSPEALIAAVQQYDVFGVIQEMEANGLLLKSYPWFLRALKSGICKFQKGEGCSSPYCPTIHPGTKTLLPAMTDELTEVEALLEVEIKVTPF